jgi:hypothetical protein
MCEFSVRNGHRRSVMRFVVSTIVTLALVLGLAPAAAPQVDNLTDAVVCNEEAARRAGNPSASPRAGTQRPSLTPEPGTRTDPSGSVVAEADDPLLEGIAAEGLRDAAYRTAYRACKAARSRGR